MSVCKSNQNKQKHQYTSAYLVVLVHGLLRQVVATSHLEHPSVQLLRRNDVACKYGRKRRGEMRTRTVIRTQKGTGSEKKRRRESPETKKKKKKRRNMQEKTYT